jgi:hypothetical protein
VKAKGENSSAEALFMLLEQQKIINELIAKLRDMKK